MMPYQNPEIRIPLAGDFMKTELITLKAKDHILDAIEILIKKKISGAPVLDENQKLVGILSEKDCMPLFLNGTFRFLSGGRVEDYMSQIIQSVLPTDSLFFIAGVFNNFPIRRLPVLEDGKLLGQISRRDILEAGRLLWAPTRANREVPDPEYHLTDEVKAALVDRSKTHNATHHHVPQSLN